MIKHQIIAPIVGAVLTTISYGLGLSFHWIDTVNWLEAFSVFTSFWCTYLCVFQSRFNYVIGIVSVVSLLALFYQQSLFSSMTLQIYLIPTLVIGWYMWGKDKATKPVEFVKPSVWFVYLVLTGIVGFISMQVNTYFGGVNALWDTVILVLSILAQFLLDRKKMENWLIWIVVDIISVFVYWNGGLQILAIQMGLFGLNAVWGLYEWWKTYEPSTILRMWKTSDLVRNIDEIAGA